MRWAPVSECQWERGEDLKDLLASHCKVVHSIFADFWKYDAVVRLPLRVQEFKKVLAFTL
jgi:hypothetical protein